MKVLTFQTPDAIKKALWVAQGFYPPQAD